MTFEELFADEYKELGLEAPENTPQQSLYESLEGADPFSEELANFDENLSSMPQPEALIPTLQEKEALTEEALEAPIIPLQPETNTPLAFYQKAGLVAATCLATITPWLQACSSTKNRIDPDTMGRFTLSETILDKVLPPTKRFDIVNFQKDAGTLLEVFKQGTWSKGTCQQTDYLLKQVLGKDYDIIPVILQSGRVIESQFELRQTLVDAIQRADFTLQKDISNALVHQYQARDSLYGLIQALKARGFSEEKLSNYEKALDAKLQNTVDGCAPTIARGLGGTLFGDANHKRELIMVRDPDLPKEKGYDPNNPPEELKEKLYYQLANDHGYYTAPRGGYSVIENPTIDDILDRLYDLDKEYRDLKNAGLSHQISDEIVLVMPTHGTQDETSGKHLFELNDGLWPISNLYEHANNLLEEHSEIKSFKVLALNCRVERDYKLSENAVVPNDKIETYFFHKSGYVTYANIYGQGEVHQASVAILLENLMHPPKREEDLIPTTPERLQQYANLDYQFSGVGSNKYNHTVNNKILEAHQAGEKKVYHPDKSNEAERIFDDEIRDLIEKLEL